MPSDCSGDAAQPGWTAPLPRLGGRAGRAARTDTMAAPVLPAPELLGGFKINCCYLLMCVKCIDVLS